MRQVFFESKFLDRVIYLDQIDSLSGVDIAKLDHELLIAIDNMQTKMHKERDGDDSDWLMKLSWKIKICERFHAAIKQVQQRDALKLETYHLSYFRQAVSNEIGPMKADQLFEQARIDATKQIDKELQA